MQKHVLDDRIRSRAVLYDLFEIAPQCVGQFHDFRTGLVVGLHRSDCLLQLIDQFDRDAGEVVDEIKRILDFVGDAGGELAEGSKLFGLDQAVLRGPQIIQRRAQVCRALTQLIQQTRILDCYDGLGGKALHQLDLFVGEWTNIQAIDRESSNKFVILEQWHDQKGTRARSIDKGNKYRIAVEITSDHFPVHV